MNAADSATIAPLDFSPSDTQDTTQLAVELALCALSEAKTAVGQAEASLLAIRELSKPATESPH